MIQREGGKNDQIITKPKTLININCEPIALLSINNDGRVSNWSLECGKRYALRVSGNRIGFEVVEAVSR
jgi:hypothetical protein